MCDFVICLCFLLLPLAAVSGSSVMATVRISLVTVSLVTETSNILVQHVVSVNTGVLGMERLTFRNSGLIEICSWPVMVEKFRMVKLTYHET